MVLESHVKRDMVLHAARNCVRKVMMCHTIKTNTLVSVGEQVINSNTFYKQNSPDGQNLH
jgi:hypothetical protein